MVSLLALCVSLITWVSDPRPASLHYAARDHFCKLNYTKKIIQFKQLGKQHTVSFQNAATITGATLCRKNFGGPCLMLF
jgi:hypothetical protein